MDFLLMTAKVILILHYVVDHDNNFNWFLQTNFEDVF
jgi:hypothetical protein